MMPVVITLPDGSTRSVAAGTPVRDVAADVSPRLAKAALVARVDDQLVDLSFPLHADARVQILTADSADALHVYRHSTAHLLAAAFAETGDLTEAMRRAVGGLEGAFTLLAVHADQPGVVVGAGRRAHAVRVSSRQHTGSTAGRSVTPCTIARPGPH